MRALNIIAALLALGFLALGLWLEAQDPTPPIAQNMERYRGR